MSAGLTLALGCADPETGETGESGETGETSGPADTDLGSEFVFDQDQLRTYELEIAPADWELLNLDPTAEIYVPGLLHFEGQTWGPIGVRYKGAYGSLYWCFDAEGNQICPKLSMKLKFTEYGDGPLFHGLERVNLHAMAGAGGGDRSKLHERLGYNLFRANEVLAPRAVHARVVINGELVGLFVVVEQIDARFAAERFPADGAGNIYKEVWPRHLDEAPYLDALRTDEGPNPSAAKMLAFATALAEGGDAGFSAVIEQWMDADALMRYVAVDRAIENWDGVFGLYDLPAGNHNYYWYEEALDDRVWLIPWDLDRTFEYPNPIEANYGAPAWNEDPGDCAGTPVFAGLHRYPAVCDPFLRGLVTHDDGQWRAAAQAFLDGLYSPAQLDARLEFYVDQIDAAVAEDPDLDHGEWLAAVDLLRADLLGLRDQLQAEIDG